MNILSKFSKRAKTSFGILILLFLLSSFYLYQVSHKTSNTNPGSTEPSILVLTNSYPDKGEATLTFPNTALSYTFNQPIAKTQVRVEITPKTDITTSLNSDNTILYVKPTGNWKFNINYEITLIGPQESILEKKTVTFISPKNVPADTEFHPKGI